MGGITSRLETINTFLKHFCQRSREVTPKHMTSLLDGITTWLVGGKMKLPITSKCNFSYLLLSSLPTIVMITKQYELS